MIISYQWLQQYLPVPVSVDELSTILTSIGLEVEAVETVEAVKGSLQGLVLGEVLTCAKHPDADKLNLTTVNIGTDEILSIVCGAPNVAAGQKVVVATIGTTLYTGSGESFKIKKSKIRGVESQGMICAEDEIGLGESHDGIMVLPADVQPGTPASEYFKIPAPDFAIHIGLTPNRSDAMSHIGVARDVCAYLTHHKGEQFAPVLPQPEINATGTEQPIKITIEATEACARYAGLSISNVTIGASPDWLKDRLKTIGVRSINNVVDITNFVLHEYGQPLHAFDADKITGNEVHVKTLPQGTPFLALDDKERKLQSTDLIICNAEEGMCIAGVFGGAKSGVSDTTTNIFLESAYFAPGSVRRTSLHHGLRTDAATHFEKGVDMAMVIPALKRAASLIAALAGGVVVADVQDVYPEAFSPVSVAVTYEYIDRICGKSFAPEAVQKLLTALGFVIKETNEKGLTVLVPSNKNDVSQPADIVEEVLRIDGLDNVPIPGRLNIALAKPFANDRKKREQIAAQLCGLGFQELVTNSIVNSKYYPERTDLVKMLNSLSAELDVLRPSMLESGLEVIQYNANRKNSNLALYEFGKTYTTSAAQQYTETPVLALWLSGSVATQQWNQKELKSDIFYLKGIIQNLLTMSGIEKVVLSYEENEILWKWKNQELIRIAEVAGKKLSSFDIKQAVYFAAINWELWTKAAEAVKIKYAEVPKFPAVQRDLAIVLDKKVTYQDVKKATEQLKIAEMQSFDLFDVFESEKLGAGKKSFALSYTFQLQDRTLTDNETDALMQQLIQTYKSKLDAYIRE